MSHVILFPRPPSGSRPPPPGGEELDELLDLLYGQVLALHAASARDDAIGAIAERIDALQDRLERWYLRRLSPSQ